MSELLSLRGYARHRGCTLSAVQRALLAGRITPVLDGERKLIDPIAADLQWARNTDPDQQQRALGGHVAPPPAAGSAAEKIGHPAALGQRDRGIEHGGGGESSREFLAAKTRREQAAAQLLEYELQLKQGELVPVTEVVRHVGERVRSTRDALIGLADQFAEKLVGIGTADQVRAILRSEIESALGKLSRPLSLTAQQS